MNILVLFGEVAFISKNETLKGIVESARKDGNNVFLFTCEGFLYHKLPAYSRGEYEIFKVPDFSNYDGAIIDFNSIQNEETRTYLISHIKRSKIPFVSFEYPLKDSCIISYDYTDVFVELIEHLIVGHGFKNIHFLDGPIENNHSKIRLSLFKQTMDKYGLSYSNDTIHFGDFNVGSGKKLADLYMQEHKELPEAFIAANDYMAIGLVEELKYYGVICPKDICVVGVDNNRMGRLMAPKITTIDLNEYLSGAEAYKNLIKMIHKEEFKKSITITGKLITNESCGCCNTDKTKPNNEFINVSVQMDQSLDLIKEVSVQLMAIRTTHEFEKGVAPLIQMLGIEFFYFCQFGTMESYYKSLELKAEGIESDSPIDEDLVWCPIAYELGSWKSYPAFKKSLLLPPKSKSAKGVYYIAMPIHQDGTPIGYTIMGNFNEELSGRVLQHLVLAFDKALANIMQIDFTNTMLARVNEKWKFDSLTKIYNRSGFYEAYTSLLDSNTDKEIGFLCIFFDLDGLKLINDKYSHKAGDDYIKKMANLLVANANESDIYARFGGDEFIMICPTYQQEFQERFFEIKDSISSEIAVSIGYSYRKIVEITNISDLIEAADKMMYEDKHTKKTSRNNLTDF